MKRPGISRLLDLQELILKFAAVERAIDFPNRARMENDVDHSFGLAMIAWFLSAYFPELDRDKLIRYALAHDLVELHAGDTFFYADEATRSAKKMREADAFKRLQKDWPDFPDMLETIQSYEEKESPEARFIYALDKILPIMVVYLGKGYTWQRLGITHKRLHEAKVVKIAVSPEISDYYNQLHEMLLQSEHFFAPPSQEI